MEPRIYHGTLTPSDIARALIADFNRGTLRAQQFGNPHQLVVQIASRSNAESGGQTALTVTLVKVTDGVSVQIGQQNWLGVAASLGQSAFMAWRNPWALISRLDDIAQDIEYLQLSERIWRVIETVASTARASFELSERLRRVVCSYCTTANEVGAGSCAACGAPLGAAQPRTCRSCGFVIRPGETLCPNCRKPV
jgi:hypothetical protein